LVASAVSRYAHARWANDGDDAYEDCYLLQSSAALDELNEAAMRGACKAPHDRLAHAMEAGCAGLYSLVRGRPVAVPAGNARWFSKPQGMGYEELYARFHPAIFDTGATIWRRQMVLSPAPEFCAFGQGLDAALAGLEALTAARETVWAGAAERTEEPRR
jgi:hypothetical protein